MRWIALITLLMVCACAKLPDVVAAPGVQRLLLTLKVEREINPNFVYIFAFRPSSVDSPTDSGPIPVVAPPWGNGFVAGNVTHFVRWDSGQSPAFLVYKFRDASLLDYFATGVPIAFKDVAAGDQTLQFEIDLSQISDAPETIRSIQMNILTMDRVPQGSGGSKNWDAIGDGRVPSGLNQWITFPVRTSGRYDNARFGDIEPSNDAPDPDLEIVDFTVEVRLQ